MALIKLPPSYQGHFRAYDAGPGIISGTVKVETEFAQRKVRLHERQTGRLFGETWSAKTTGAYRFVDLPEGRVFMVVGLDYTNTNNAVIADRITPET